MTRIMLALLMGFLACDSAASRTPSEQPMRVVSLAPHLTELVYTLDAEKHLVGAVEWSDYPEAAQALPRIGDAFRFDLERIVALETTHALSWVGGTPLAAVEQLQSLGIEVIELETQTLDQIADALRQLGALLGQQAHAAAAVAEYDRRRSAYEQRVAERPQIDVFYQVSERPLFTLGGPHVINEVFELCGARNVFEGLNTEASVVGREAVIGLQPDAMIAGQNQPALISAEQHGQRSALDHWLEYPHIPAVACGHLWLVDPALLVRPTPRILDGADRLCEWLDQVRQHLAEDPACSNDRG